MTYDFVIDDKSRNFAPDFVTSGGTSGARENVASIVNILNCN